MVLELMFYLGLAAGLIAGLLAGLLIAPSRKVVRHPIDVGELCREIQAQGGLQVRVDVDALAAALVQAEDQAHRWPGEALH